MNAHTKRYYDHPDDVIRDTSRVPNQQSPALIVTEEQLRRFGGGDASYARRELRAMLSKEPDVDEAPVTECPQSVRIAGPRDEQACLDLWLMDLNENAAHVAPVDPDKIMANIQQGTRRRGSVVAVIDGPDAPAALCVLAAMQWHWSQAWFFQELCTFVHPEHRRTHHADDLLQFQKWVSYQQTKGFGYPVHVLNGVLGAWRVHGKVAMYRRKFRQVGSVHIYPTPKMTGN